MDPKVDTEPEDLKTRLAKGYDTIATVYNEWTAQHSALRMVYLERLLGLMQQPAEKASDGTTTATTDKPSLSFLELGCGAGLPVTKYLLARDPRWSVTANDLSPEQVRLGKANLAEYSTGTGTGDDQKQRLTWLEGDMMALSFAPESFDAVLAFYSIIHLPLREQEVVLARIAGWLRPGGYLLANFSEGEMEGTVKDGWLAEGGWMYWSGFGVEGTLGKVKEVGLEVLTGEVNTDDVEERFLWVIARKPL